MLKRLSPIIDRMYWGFTRHCQNVEEERKMKVVVTASAMMFVNSLFYLPFYGVMSLWDDDWANPGLQEFCQCCSTGFVIVISFCVLGHLYLWGLTTRAKIIYTLALFVSVTYAAVIGQEEEPWYLWFIVLLDIVWMLQSSEDELILDRLSFIFFAGHLIYVNLHVLSAARLIPNIHPFNEEKAYDVWDIEINIALHMMPIITNYVFVRPYARGARVEAERRSTEAVTMASKVARALANFDLDGADKLMAEAAKKAIGGVESPIQEPLELLLRNLRSYRPFLPNYLFPHAQDGDPTNGTIAEAMQGSTTCWRTVESAVERLRDPDYTLLHFHEDMETAFPELKLYALDTKGLGCSSGYTGFEERQRTFGALYSVYCISRLDIDGKAIFTYGVDEQGKPITDPTDEVAERRRSFYSLMEWDKMLQLFLRAGLLRNMHYHGELGVCKKPSTTSYLHMEPRYSTNSSLPESSDGTPSSPTASRPPTVDRFPSTATECRLQVNRDRMTAFLALTSVHDVMKNTALTPVVQRKHAPYHGYAEGSAITDHDVALTYMMEHFSGLLPSFNGLEPGQRVPVFFSQCKMEFNNGWLVQGEAPPGALFSSLKRVITLGGASEADISFYFAHWLTDLAGAIPFGARPWPGSEKFVIGFPRHVLVAFLDSFQYVDRLANASEVQVMEEYLRHRWSALGPPVKAPTDGSAIATMRVALMAQGFELAAVAAVQEMEPEDREVLATELARTGLRLQFEAAPEDVSSEPAGPAVLVYYSPALIQKAGAEEAGEALRVLAAVFRAARELFPLETSGTAVERTVVVRIEKLKVLTPSEIAAAGQWLLRQVSPSCAVADQAMHGDVDKPSAGTAFIHISQLVQAEGAAVDVGAAVVRQ